MTKEQSAATCGEIVTEGQLHHIQGAEKVSI